MIFDERLILNKDSRENVIYDEHLVRYRLAGEMAKGKIILDIACGSGYGAKMLAEAGAAKVVAVDVDEAAVKEAEKNYGSPAIEFKPGNAEDVKENDRTFDLITSFETIEHLQNPEKYLAEIARVVKDDGFFLVSTPNKDIFGQKNPFHIHEFTRAEFEIILKKYFKSVRILEQTNGIASLIKGEENGEVIFADSGAPFYFIAVCSKQDSLASDQIKKSFVSVNPAALERIKNNPAVKLVDKIYSLAVKIPGVKKILNFKF